MLSVSPHLSVYRTAQFGRGIFPGYFLASIGFCKNKKPRRIFLNHQTSELLFPYRNWQRISQKCLENYGHHRYHEALNKVTPADVDSGKHRWLLDPPWCTYLHFKDAWCSWQSSPACPEPFSPPYSRVEIGTTQRFGRTLNLYSLRSVKHGSHWKTLMHTAKQCLLKLTLRRTRKTKPPHDRTSSVP